MTPFHSPADASSFTLTNRMDCLWAFSELIPLLRKVSESAGSRVCEKQQTFQVLVSNCDFSKQA